MTAIDRDTVRAGLVSLPYAVRGSAYGKYTVLGRRFKVTKQVVILMGTNITNIEPILTNRKASAR